MICMVMAADGMAPVSVRQIVAEELMKNVVVPNCEIATRIKNELEPSISYSEAISVIVDIKTEILSAMVNPVWFHDALMSYTGSVDDHNITQELYNYVGSFKPSEEQLPGNIELSGRIFIWYKYCISRLQKGDKTSCVLKSRIDSAGRLLQRWVLTLKAFREHLEDVIFSEQLNWLFS